MPRFKTSYLLSLTITLLIVLCITSISFAGNHHPFAGTALEEISLGKISSSDMFESSFLILYQLAEQDINGEKAYRSFSKMRHIYRIHGHNKYLKNEIVSDELRQLLTDLHAAADNPQTAKDYFYRALLDIYYTSGSIDTSPGTQKERDNMQYIIDNYPDTPYAEYALIFLASFHETYYEFDLAIAKYNEYMTKYGPNAKLKAIVYYSFATLYHRLYGNPDFYGDLVTDPEVKITVMIEYANNLFTEFPDRKAMIATLSEYLAIYYKRIGDDHKALEYYKKIYEDPDPYLNYINLAVSRARDMHMNKKEYDKVEKLFDYAQSRYSNRASFREMNKRSRSYLLEAKKFGYNPFEDSSKSKLIYDVKKEKIDKFRTDYETYWDADNNLIKPLPKDE
ncbi:hypothetical protein ACFL2A_00760 [Thermodesulfobacteriota bacterium]